MTQISLETVAHLAALSNIALDDQELESLQADISTIVDHIDALGELNTDGVKPTYQVTDLENISRDDVVSDDGIDGETLVRLAPEHHDNQIKVPKVL